MDLFGEFHYEPAATNLVDSIGAASLNLASAAVDSLQKLFPGSPENFTGLEAASEYFTKRLAGAGPE